MDIHQPYFCVNFSLQFKKQFDSLNNFLKILLPHKMHHGAGKVLNMRLK